MKSIHLYSVGNTNFGKTIPFRVYNLVEETRKQHNRRQSMTSNPLYKEFWHV